MPKPKALREKEYRVRAVHRPSPDVQRLTELVIRLAIQRREIDRATRGNASLSLPRPSR